MSDIKLTQEEFEKLTGELVSNTVKKAFQEEMDQIDRKFIIHPEMTKEQIKSQQDKEQEERFIDLVKFACKKDFTEAKRIATEIKTADPMAEGTPADGGYLVPAVTQARILRLIPTFGQARNECTIMPMGKADTVNIPQKLTGASVSWVDEAGSITSSKPTLTYIQLVAKKAAGLTALSNEVLADANVDLMNYILSLFAEAFGTEEDSQVFAGSGSPFYGIFYGGHTFGKEQFVADTDSVSYSNILDAVYGIDQLYLRNAKWYAHRTMISNLRKILDANDRPLWVDANAGGLPALAGYPVQLIENAPNSSTTTAGKPVLLLGNLKNSIIGNKANMSIKFSDEAVVDSTSMFQADLSAVRLIMRMGFNAGMVGAYSAISIAD